MTGLFISSGPTGKLLVTKIHVTIRWVTLIALSFPVQSLPKIAGLAVH